MMHHGLTTARALVTLLTIAGLLLLHARPAEAKWNPQRFARTLKWADKAFTDGNYRKARELYTEARAELQTSLEGDEIPDDQREKARLALGTLDYQLARTTQLMDGCHAGYLAFGELRSTEQLEFAVGVKVEVRMAETLLCRARERIAEGDLARAHGDVDQAGALLAATGERRMHVALTEEQADDVRSSLEKAADQLIATLASRGTWSVDDCGLVQETVKVGDRLPTSVVLHGLEDLRKRAVQSCGTSPAQPVFDEHHAPRTTPPSTDGDGLVWVPWVLMGVGGLALVGAGINEVRLIPTRDEFRSTRDVCETRGERCTEAVILSTEVESGQLLSTTLLIGGVVLGGAGLVWWLWPDDPPSAPSVQVVPVQGGAVVGASFTLD